jgi:outer membrane receptor protein involved in Fe transport
MQPLKKLDLRFAYRFFDVQQTYQGILKERPFISKHRAFVSIDYATNRDWKLNYTITYNGAKRIVHNFAYPTFAALPTQSPSYFLMNAQISKSFGKRSPMDLYFGVENISNYFQQNTIASPNDPFSPNFDASLIWGPVTGRMMYMGWRIKIK